jgi:hypothetical protein
MRIGRYRSGGIDRHHLHIIARTLCDMRQSAAPDPAKPVDPDSDCHVKPSYPRKRQVADTQTRRHFKGQKCHNFIMLAQTCNVSANDCCCFR